MERKTITWKPGVQGELRAIDRLSAFNILVAIDRYSLSGEGDVIPLQGIEPREYRLRVGEYRVRFLDHADSIEILSVGHRRDIYR